MARNPARPYFDPGHAITCNTPTAVKGKRILGITAGPSSDAARPGAEALFTAGYLPAGSGADFGVSGFDTDPYTKSVLVYRLRSIIMPVTVGATAVAVGPVAVDAEGRVVPVADGAAIVGWALAAGAPGTDVPVDRSVQRAA